MKFQYNLVAFLLISLLFMLPFNSFSQRIQKLKKMGSLELVGTIKSEGGSTGSAKISITNSDGETDEYTVESSGKFTIILKLNDNYKLVVTRPGAISRTVTVNSAVPEEEKYVEYSYKFNVDLPADNAVNAPEKTNKPIARIRYDETVSDFEYDKLYTQALIKEINDAKAILKKNMEEMEKARLDSIAGREKDLARQKAISDSILLADKTSKEKAELERKEKERKALELAKRDSTEKAEALKTAAANTAREKLEREVAAREGFRRDSVEKAEQARQIALKIRLEKEREDSVQRVEKSERERAEASARKQEELKLAKQKADSLERVKEQKRIAEEENRQKRAAELEAQRVAQSKERSVVQSVPKLEKEYPAGITDEVLKEERRTLYRTVVVYEGSTTTYYKIVTDWGGVFFFKNEASITETIYDTDVKLFRQKIKK